MNQRYPSLYQINTRVWLTELGRRLGRPATLDDVPETDLDRWQAMGFDWIWFLSVWKTGPKSRQVSRSEPGWQKEFQETLPDLKEDDIGGSGFAITGYTVHPDLGGEETLSRLRDRLKKRGLKLMLDFVPNHMGLDHPWIDEHPDYFIPGTEAELKSAPQNFTRLKTAHLPHPALRATFPQEGKENMDFPSPLGRGQGEGPEPLANGGEGIFAYGRDPYFAGWPDTLQLNYANPAAQDALIGELLNIARQCDGVRCDMAMLVLPEIFERTWGRPSPPFWPKAIQTIRSQHPNFCFMAEVYWDLEWTLQQQGFDYTYDKRLYDRLREGHARPVREHLMAEMEYQNKSARFLENHDEPRAATTFEPHQHRAAAIITFLTPGLRFFHQGQFEGRKNRISPHLVRAPEESPDPALREFYGALLSVLKNPAVLDGQWRRLDCRPAWENNTSWEAYLVFLWEEKGGERLLVTVNYAPRSSQCLVPIPLPGNGGAPIRLRDTMSPACYERSSEEMRTRGLFLDLPPWGYHVFDL